MGCSRVAGPDRLEWRFWAELIWFLGCWARLGFLFPSLFSISYFEPIKPI